MGRWIGLRDFDELTLSLAEEVLVHVNPKDGSFGSHLVELPSLFGPFQWDQVEESFHVQDRVIALGEGCARRCGVELSLMFPQGLDRLVNLFISHRAFVRLERNRVGGTI